jgi:integrase/recombinase XerD
MSALRRSLSDYLAMRRELDYKLERAGQLLLQFVDFCDQSGTEIVTVEAALKWAVLPEGCSPGWGAFRLCVVRGFARYLHALDPRTAVPPTNLLPTNYGRARPFLYSTDQVTALLEAARQMPTALRAASTEAVVGLLASTGMRVGEALALDCRSVDLSHSRLTIHQTKFNKSREVALTRRPSMRSPLTPPDATSSHPYRAKPHSLCRHPELACSTATSTWPFRTWCAEPASKPARLRVGRGHTISAIPSR